MAAPQFSFSVRELELVDLILRLQNQLAFRHARIDDALEDLRGQGDDSTEVRLRVADALDDVVAVRTCRVCACTEESACEAPEDAPDEEQGPCGWAEADLCTHCVTVEVFLNAAVPG